MKCELCNREVENTSVHHLIPRTRHKNKRNKRTFTREEVKNRTAELCSLCHDFIHKQFTEKELERNYNSIGLLKEHRDVKKFVEWIAPKPDGFTVPHSRSRRGRR